MKKQYFILLLLFLFVCYRSFAQSYIGFRAGAANINFYHLRSIALSEAKLTPYYSYNVSLFYKRAIGKNRFIGVELDNKQFNSNIKIAMHCGVPDNSGLEALYKINMLYVHVFHEGNFYTGKKISIVGDIGLYLSFVLASKVGGKFWDTRESAYVDSTGASHYYPSLFTTHKDESPARDVNIVSFGFRLALGFDVPVTNKLAISCRGSYCMGLSNVINEQASTEGMALHLRDFGLTVGLVYKLKKKKEEN